MTSSRLEQCFKRARDENRAALGIFITGGDPDIDTSSKLLLKLPESGADFVELGMPFSDPMADGPAIQESSMRALKAGVTLGNVLSMAKVFRKAHPHIPLVLMGYYNPVYVYGVDRFLTEARESGVDGLIMVDLPPEEDEELCIPALAAGISFIRLITPTTDNTRLEKIVSRGDGFLYYVSVTGVTGMHSASATSVSNAMTRIRKASDLPIVVGFGISDAAAVQAVASEVDGVVVGSAVVRIIAEHLGPRDHVVKAACDLVESLASGTVKT